MKLLSQIKINKTILIILAAAVVVTGVLLLIFWPQVRQSAYNSKVASISKSADKAVTRMEKAAELSDDDTWDSFFERVTEAASGLDVVTAFNELNAKYSDVQQTTLDAAGLSDFEGTSTSAKDNIAQLAQMKSTLVSLTEKFQNEVALVEFDTETQHTAIADIISQLNTLKTQANLMNEPGISAVAYSVGQMIDELKVAVADYKVLSDNYTGVEEGYGTQQASMQSIISWVTLRDNATKDEYKEFCQQKIDEFTQKAAEGLSALNASGKEMLEKISSFEENYTTILKRLELGEATYPTKDAFKTAAENAAYLSMPK